MEYVSIQIPAALYTSIYERHDERTSAVISECLTQLLAGSPGDTQAGNFQYPRPGSGTITGKVWEIADQIREKIGAANRNAVIQACIQQGININTANTQYSYWSKANPSKDVTDQ